MRKKQYGHGRRREVIGLLMQSGCITNQGLMLYWGNEYPTKSHVISTLEKEGLVIEKKVTTPDRRILRMYTMNKVYTKTIDTEKYGKWAMWYYMTYASIVAAESRQTETFRKIRAANTGFAELMFYMAGYYSAAYEKAKMLMQGEQMKDRAYYFMSSDIKDTNVTSREIGVMYHPDQNAYVVYAAGKHRPKWESGVEEQFWDTTVTPIEKHYRSDHHYRSDEYQAILLCEDECAALLLNGEKSGGKKYLTLPSMYRRGLYFIPKNEFGVRLLSLMKEKKWKERTLRAILKDLYGTAELRTGIPHDAKAEDRMYLCFCVPDLEKLNGFLKNAEALSHPERNIILCFKEQEEFIRRIAKDYCTVQTVDMVLPEINRRDDF